MNRFLSVFLLFFSLPARGLTVEPLYVKNALSIASFVAEIEVLDIHSHQSNDEIIYSESVSRVLKILDVNEQKGWIPVEGESFAISSLGGEIENLGMFLTGYPRLHKNQKYRAHLQRQQDNRFTIAGLEFGITPLNKTRTFSRNRTDGSNGEGNGPFLFWDKSYFPIPFFISSSTFKGISGTAKAIDASFITWQEPSTTTLNFQPMGCTSEWHNQNDGINNIIYVSDSWPFDPAAIAITRNFYISGTSSQAGLILDSDLLLNGIDHKFTTTNENGKHDIQNIVTHELGHFIGLGHETDPIDKTATMYATAEPNETLKRTLNDSDLTALRDGYSGVSIKMNLFTQEASCDLRSGTSCLAVHTSAPQEGTWIILCVWLWGTLIAGHSLVRPAAKLRRPNFFSPHDETRR